MSTLTGKFSVTASSVAVSAEFLSASLALFCADTRKGMTQDAQHAYAIVAAHAGESDRRSNYLLHYKAAAGGNHEHAHDHRAHATGVKVGRRSGGAGAGAGAGGGGGQSSK